MKGFSPSERVETATINDRVRDMMVIAVPRLLIDEQISLVEPDEFLEDDGGAKIFAKQFEYDDTPRMDVTDEVYDLMRLAVPSVGIPVDDAMVAENYLDLPDDGLGFAWEEETCCRSEGAAEAISESSPVEDVHLIGAPAEIRMLAVPTSVPLLTMPDEIPEDTVSEIKPFVEEHCDEEKFEIEADAPLVTFSFGPSKVPDGGWTVCFSF